MRKKTEIKEQKTEKKETFLKVWKRKLDQKTDIQR